MTEPVDLREWSTQDILTYLIPFVRIFVTTCLESYQQIMKEEKRYVFKASLNNEENEVEKETRKLSDNERRETIRCSKKDSNRKV